MRSLKRIAGRQPDVIKEQVDDLNSMRAQLSNMFVEDFNRNQYNVSSGVAARIFDSPPKTEEKLETEDKTHFFGFNYLPESLNGGLVDWSVSHGHTSNELHVNDASSSVTISIADNTGILPSGEIYIGDPPTPAVQTFDGFGNPIAPAPLQYQAPYTITTVGTSTGFNFGLNKNEKYAVVELEREDVPMSVYICGRMLTLGILGTDVECAFTGDKLVFEPGVVSAISFGNRITMIIEYDDEICHYNVGEAGQVTYVDEHSPTINITLVSRIVKKKGVHLHGIK